MVSKRLTLCRIYENIPEAIEAVSFSPCSKFIAISRHFGSIQLLDSRSFHVYAILPNIFKHGSTNSIIWVNKSNLHSKSNVYENYTLSDYRILTTGLHGMVVDWDLGLLLPVNTSQSYGGAIFSSSLSSDSTRLYLGCDDSTIRVFSLYKTIRQLNIYESELNLLDTIRYPSGKILSIALYDNLLFCGTSDSIIYKKCNGETTSMKLYCAAAKKIQVWALVYLKNDNMLISGDSVGFIRFWDIFHGIEIRSIHQHSAEILCLSVSPDQKTLYAAGVDMKLSILTKHSSVDNWSVVSVRYPHKGAIKSLDIDLVHGNVATGGEDCNLCLFRDLKDLSGLPNQVAKLLPVPFPAESPIDVSQYDSMVLCKNSRAVHIWQLPPVSSNEESPSRLASIELDKSQGDLTVGSISKGKAPSDRVEVHVCVGNIEVIKLFSITNDSIKLIDTNFIDVPVHSVKFVTDELILASNFNKISKTFHLLNYSIKSGIVNDKEIAQPIVRIEILKANLVSLFYLSGIVGILNWESWKFFELPEMKPPEIITSVCYYSSRGDEDKIIAIGSLGTYYMFDIVNSQFKELNFQIYNKIPGALIRGESVINYSFAMDESLVIQSCTFLSSFTPNGEKMIDSDSRLLNKVDKALKASKRLRLGPPLLNEPKFRIFSPFADEKEDVRTGDVDNADGVYRQNKSIHGWKVFKVSHLIYTIYNRDSLLAFQIPTLDIDVQERAAKYGAL